MAKLQCFIPLLLCLVGLEHSYFVSGSEARVVRMGDASAHPMFQPEKDNLSTLSLSQNENEKTNERKEERLLQYDSWYNEAYNDESEDDTLGMEWVILIIALPFGILPFYAVFSLLLVIPLANEYKKKGITIAGRVTGAKKKVRQEFHGHANEGLFGGYNLSGHTTEKTMNRILDVEYPVIIDGERKLVRKKFRYLHKKTFDRPSQTDEVELYLLPERGVFSGYPRDEFHLSASEKCKDYSSLSCFSIIFLVCLSLGGPTSPPVYTFAVLIGDAFAGLYMCYLARQRTLRSGKILRFVPPEDLAAFNFDGLLEDAEKGTSHHSVSHAHEENQIHVLGSVPPQEYKNDKTPPMLPRLVAHAALSPIENVTASPKQRADTQSSAKLVPESTTTLVTAVSRSKMDNTNVKTTKTRSSTYNGVSFRGVKNGKIKVMAQGFIYYPPPSTETKKIKIAWKSLSEKQISATSSPRNKLRLKSTKHVDPFVFETKNREDLDQLYHDICQLQHQSMVPEDSLTRSMEETGEGETKPESEKNPDPQVDAQIIPTDMDICFGVEGHPGTKAWRKAVAKSMRECADDAFGPEVFQNIKNRLKNRRFLVKREHGGEWKLAEKADLVTKFRVAFKEEQQRFFEMSTSLCIDDASL